MQTPEQLRQRAARLREAGLHAERDYGSAEIAEAERLERQADLLEGKTEDEAKGLRIQLKSRDERIGLLHECIRRYKALIENFIECPVEGLSSTQIGRKLYDVKIQRDQLAEAIAKANDLAGLEHAKRIARNMGLLKEKAA
ncbi:hypothetical protein [Azorhizophilus paspali]|uniref:hypothetical protein n=1 Tax=Azorhizophilus paspali TaxID=69963 RepID=UPI0037493E15